MAKLIVSNLVSLDGYCAGPGGDLGVLPMDAAFNAYNLERLRTAGTLLLGGTTFSMFSAYWPTVADDAGTDPVLRETARLNGAMNKVVVSDTIRLDAAAPWGDADVVARQQAHTRIAHIKASTQRDVLVFGSHVLWNELLAQGLVDELHLLMGSVLLGGGVRAFE
ncbi:MAG TPA: dihydrofolate reductase family protein, partial [Rhizobacter sp.]|nr:dihydrofolate reductase family protein [Rhizobacter sp.]